jgi:hypothetical protein
MSYKSKGGPAMEWSIIKAAETQNKITNTEIMRGYLLGTNNTQEYPITIFKRMNHSFSSNFIGKGKI